MMSSSRIHSTFVVLNIIVSLFRVISKWVSEWALQSSPLLVHREEVWWVTLLCQYEAEFVLCRLANATMMMRIIMTDGRLVCIWWMRPGRVHQLKNWRYLFLADTFRVISSTLGHTRRDDEMVTHFSIDLRGLQYYFNDQREVLVRSYHSSMWGLLDKKKECK